MFRYTLYHGTDTYVLPNDPKGWDSAELGITRSPKFSGMNYSQILSLSFICGSGKEFIDNIYNTLGIDEEIRITVEEACECVDTMTSSSYSSDYSSDYEKGGGSIDCDFELLFEGILDLFNISILDEETQVPLIEQGLNQKLNSRLDTKVNLFDSKTLDGSEFSNIDAPYTLNMHSKALVSKGGFGFLNDIGEDTAVVDHADSVRALYLTLPLFINSSDGNGFNSPAETFPLLLNRVDASDGNMPVVYHNYTNFDQDVSFNINFNGSFKLKENFSTVDVFEHYFTMRIALIYGNVPVEGLDPVYGTCTYIDLITPVQITLENTYKIFPVNIVNNINVTLEPGKQVYFAVVLTDPSTPDPDPDPDNLWGNFYSNNVDFGDLSIASIETIDIADPSTATSQKIFETIAKISQGILSVEDPVRSDYYGRIGATPHSNDENGCGCYSAITSGYMIRQYPTSGDSKRGINISLSELFDSLDSIDNIGIGFEKSLTNGWQLRWERKDFFYQDKEIIHLDHVPDIKRSVAQDLAFNNISIGFEKWQINDLNGLDEYCSQSQYTNGLKSVSQELQKLSPIIASPYIIETIRRKPYSISATTDTDFDSDNFIIALNREQEYGGEPTKLDVAEKDENFISVQNVLSPETAYNLRFATSKNLLRNIPSISPIITKYSGRNIKFTSGEGNKAIITRDSVECPSYYGSQELSGDMDIQWDSNLVEEPLFVAEYLEFQYPITREQYLSIKDAHENPDSLVHNGYITISNEKETFKGFLIDLKYKQKTGLSTFKLIRKYD